MKIKINEAKCIDCKKCYTACPMMKEYSSSPKSLMKQMIKNEKLNNKIAYSCMLCGICKQECPKDIDLKDMFYEMRKDLFNNKNKKLIPKGYNTVKFHQINSFSSLFSNNINSINTKTIFLPGCSLTSYSSDIVQKTFEYLKEHINDISLLVKCCGKPTEAMGDIKKFEKYYSNLEKIFEEDNITEVIVACPNCFSTIKKYSNNIKVTSIWEIINKYKVPKELINYYDNLEFEFTLHDPCPMRNEDKVHNDVREILKSLGLKIEEFEKNRESSECCGSGGMVRVTNPSISKAQTIKRASEAKTDTVISYCESCCEAMLIANKKSLHILDFLFNEEVINKKKFTQNKTSTLNKWSERYKGTKINKSGRK
ncbi:MAG: (Fe-S)-binding protein [Peptostreptococcaceae bacterium]